MNDLTKFEYAHHLQHGTGQAGSPGPTKLSNCIFRYRILWSNIKKKLSIWTACAISKSALQLTLFSWNSVANAHCLVRLFSSSL